MAAAGSCWPGHRSGPHMSPASPGLTGTGGTERPSWKPAEASADTALELCDNPAGSSFLLQLKAGLAGAGRGVLASLTSPDNSKVRCIPPCFCRAVSVGCFSSRPEHSLYSPSCAVGWAAFRLFSHSLPCLERRVHHPGHQLVQLRQPVEPENLLHHRETQSQGVSPASARRASAPTLPAGRWCSRTRRPGPRSPPTTHLW